ncbi:hypothetical protein BDP27DRAFT_1431232 [Rhodocollybia butyracea]|uniref:Uncharacterized protein n=1 Tax=Rhodocollybia butyracea TaxID=206335 RepID=A0A9P5TY74_9AGAR|nr:hypothetical protein BDP27DRAFT_1431232 [Rhodocollybia butyracea]
MAKVFENIVGALDMIYEVAQCYHDTKHEQTLSALYECLSLFDTMIRKCSAKQLIAKMLKKLDPGDNDAPPLVVELESEADTNQDNTLRSEIQQSFNAAHSENISSFEETTKVDIALHAELNVFQTLEAALIKGEQPYWVIGVSKLMCFGCYTVIGKAFPAALKASYLHNLSLLQDPITVQGCHGKPYASWAAPDLSFAEHYVGFDLNLKVRRWAEQFIRDALCQHMEYRRLSEEGEDVESKLIAEIAEAYAHLNKKKSSPHLTTNTNRGRGTTRRRGS